MNSHSTTLSLLQNTLQKIQEEAKAGKHQTIYDILEHKHFPTDTLLLDTIYLKQNIKDFGREKFIKCMINVMQRMHFTNFAKKNKEKIIAIMASKKIEENFFDHIVSYILISNDCGDSITRCHYAILKLLAQDINTPIYHYAFADNKTNSHQFIASNNLFASSDNDIIRSDDIIIFDPTLYMVTDDPHRYLRTLKKVFPWITAINNPNIIDLQSKPQIALVIQSIPQLQQEILNLGYNFKKVNDHAIKKIIATQRQYSFPSISKQGELSKQSIEQSTNKYHNEIKPFLRKYKKQDAVFEPQTNWLKQSLNILNPKCILSKKPTDAFKKEWHSFQAKINSLKTIEELRQAEDQLKKLENLWLKTKPLLQAALEKDKESASKHTEAKEQPTLDKMSVSLPHITQTYEQILAEQKKLLLHDLEQYAEKKDALAAIYQATNEIYNSIYQKNYKSPKILEEKDNMNAIKTEINQYSASEENIQKMKQHIETLYSLNEELQNEIGRLKKLKTTYEQRINSKENLSSNFVGTTFGKKKHPKRDAAPAAKTEARFAKNKY